MDIAIESLMQRFSAELIRPLAKGKLEDVHSTVRLQAEWLTVETRGLA